MEDIKLLARAYRSFLIELGTAFKELKETEGYAGFADTFIDAVKSPEVGFTVAEANNLIKIADKFGLLEPNDLPSHHAMKLMATRKVDMDLLESAQTLSVTDFKELLKDKELGTQERTYRYEIVARAVESGSIRRVRDDEVPDALSQLKQTYGQG